MSDHNCSKSVRSNSWLFMNKTKWVVLPSASVDVNVNASASARRDVMTTWILTSDPVCASTSTQPEEGQARAYDGGAIRDAARGACRGRILRAWARGKSCAIAGGSGPVAAAPSLAAVVEAAAEAAKARPKMEADGRGRSGEGLTPAKSAWTCWSVMVSTNGRRGRPMPALAEQGAALAVRRREDQRGLAACRLHRWRRRMLAPCALRRGFGRGAHQVAGPGTGCTPSASTAS